MFDHTFITADCPNEAVSIRNAIRCELCLADVSQMIQSCSAPQTVASDFLRTETGREPVRDWLQDLPRRERRIIGVDITTVQFRWPLGMPLVDNVGSGLSEVRSKPPTRIARTFFFGHGQEIILLHGFIKKTRKTPKEDRALALQRKNAYIKSSKK